MINTEFSLQWPPDKAEEHIAQRLKAAEAGLLSSRDLIATLQERVAALLKENEQQTAKIRKLERRVKQLEAQLGQFDDDAPIDISPWERLMKKRDGVEDAREHTGLLEDE